jgi:hypothetical protein
MAERINIVDRAENIVADIVNKRHAEASKVAFTKFNDPKAQNDMAWWYEMKKYPTTHKSMDDKDLLLPKDGDGK